LGLETNYSEEELKKAFKKLSKKYHPDVAGAGSTKLFVRIKEAYTLLSSAVNGGSSLLTHQSIFTIIKQ
jgi:molecular chaperone DnaJ